jgi:hypothetical protein
VCFVVGKNYRLQDIQLSKSFFYPGDKSLGNFGALGISPPDPSAHFTRGAPKPHSVRSPELSSLTHRGRLPILSARRGYQGTPPSANAGGIRKLIKVENTGLEPVTSWLQTRRSPS